MSQHDLELRYFQNFRVLAEWLESQNAQPSLCIQLLKATHLKHKWCNKANLFMPEENRKNQVIHKS